MLTGKLSHMIATNLKLKVNSEDKAGEAAGLEQEENKDQEQKEEEEEVEDEFQKWSLKSRALGYNSLLKVYQIGDFDD